MSTLRQDVVPVPALIFFWLQGPQPAAANPPFVPLAQKESCLRMDAQMNLSEFENVLIGRKTMRLESRGCLEEGLLEHVLIGLGFVQRPEPNLESLRAIYAAWCARVPFDNVRKLIHVRNTNPGALPGITAEDFFEGWLRFGTGGTCWAGAGALQSLLRTLGYHAVRGIGTMLVMPDLPPNHGTVLVSFGHERYLVDNSILHGDPVRLDENVVTSINHGAWGVKSGWRTGRWHIQWRPLNRLNGFECRLERFGATMDEFQSRHEQTRSWSPFNYQLSVRLNSGNEVVGIGAGQTVRLHDDGQVSSSASSAEERKRLLIEEIGMSEEIVDALPPDQPTPPPPH